MTDEVDKPRLEKKYIWIIDDDIPIELLENEIDDMLSGERVIDRGTLINLLQYEGWIDDPVKSLVTQLVHEAGDVNAFIHPASAIVHLLKGGIIPDSIVYDLGYQNISTRNSLEYLERILDQCVSVVQVYTKEPLEEAGKKLQNLLSSYPTRLEEPRNKVDTDAIELATSIARKIDSSLSARLAGKIRKLTNLAIESVLVQIDDLPIQIAVRLLTGEHDTPNELELVEFFAVKVTEALGQKTELKETIGNFAVNKGVPEQKIKSFSDELVTLLTTHVKEFILHDDQLLLAVKEVWQEMVNAKSDEKIKDTEEIVKRFLAFRLYSKPTDDFVRTGDIIHIGELTDEPAELYLVLTPICDLDKFWKKARGVVTVAKMYPLLEPEGISKTHSYGNKKFQVGASITAKQPMILPSVPTANDVSQDYMLFIYEIENQRFEDTELMDVGSKNRSVSSPLTYSQLESVRRLCKVSEPFLSGILSDIQSRLFRLGLPNFPTEEKSRLSRIIEL